MTEEKFCITLFCKKYSVVYTDLAIVGIRLIERVPYDKIQLFKNDKMQAEYPTSLIEKLDFQTMLFPKSPILFKENDKIGIKLV